MNISGQDLIRACSAIGAGLACQVFHQKVLGLVQ